MPNMKDILKKECEFWDMTEEDAMRAECFFMRVVISYSQELILEYNKTENSIIKKILGEDIQDINNALPCLKIFDRMISTILLNKENEGNEDSV